jgi:hypothetical protein
VARTDVALHGGSAGLGYAFDEPGNGVQIALSNDTTLVPVRQRASHVAARAPAGWFVGAGASACNTSFPRLDPPRAWAGAIGDFFFEGPSRNDDPDSIKRSEFRAMWRGVASLKLTMQAPTSKLARIALKAALHSGPTAGPWTDVAAVTAAGAAYTTEPT